METRAPRSEAATAHQATPGTTWLSRMLDELGYGMLLLDAQGQVLHPNHAARSACASGHPLQLLGRKLQTRHSEHTGLLNEALEAAPT